MINNLFILLIISYIKAISKKNKMLINNFIAANKFSLVKPQQLRMKNVYKVISIFG